LSFLPHQSPSFSKDILDKKPTTLTASDYFTKKLFKTPWLKLEIPHDKKGIIPPSSSITLTTVSPIAVVKLDDSQKVKQLAENYKEYRDFLTNDFSFGTHNNIVMHTDYSKEISAGFVGVDNSIVYSHKSPGSNIEIAISEQ